MKMLNISAYFPNTFAEWMRFCVGVIVVALLMDRFLMPVVLGWLD